MNIDELVEKAVRSVRRKKNLLGKGVDGLVYAVDENTALKLHLGRLDKDGNIVYYRDSSRKSAEYEFNIGSDLYQQGVQVPQYFGLFEPNKPSSWKRILDASSPSFFWGVFMERIHGVQYQNLSADLQKEAKDQHQQQIELLKKLGYSTTDSLPDHNTLFDREKNKLYLYDVVRWERK